MPLELRRLWPLVQCFRAALLSPEDPLRQLELSTPTFEQALQQLDRPFQHFFAHVHQLPHCLFSPHLPPQVARLLPAPPSQPVLLSQWVPRISQQLLLQGLLVAVP